MTRLADKDARRTARNRYKLKKAANGKPRLSVFRSNKHIHAQIIDDVQGVTLAAATSLALDKGSNIDAAKQVGKLIAQAAQGAKIESVVFDRGGYLYHGRVKALAESARENGLKL